MTSGSRWCRSIRGGRWLDEVTGWALRPYLSRRLPENISFVVTMQDEQASAARYFIPRDQATFLRLDEAGTRVTRESLLAGQQLNALLDQLQAQVLQTQVMQTEHLPMTEQERARTRSTAMRRC